MHSGNKLENIDAVLCKSLWGGVEVEWSFKASIGCASGLLSIWNK